MGGKGRPDVGWGVRWAVEERDSKLKKEAAASSEEGWMHETGLGDS